jgi:8-oxo-dGTP diphosphatase
MKYGTMSYLVSDKGILMLKKGERKNDPNSGYYTLPGGNLTTREKGLTSPKNRLESAIRETKNETGIKLINPILKGVILFDNQDRIFKNWINPDNFYVYIFSAREYSGKLKESKEGVPLWVPENNLESLPKNPGDKLMYEWLNDWRDFIGVIKHKGKNIDESGTWVDWI